MQQPLRNVCEKFKVDPWSRFRTAARQVFTIQKLFPSEIPLAMKIATTKLSLNTFSDQITICQISFEILDVKQILKQKDKYLSSIRVFPFFHPTFLLEWNKQEIFKRRQVKDQKYLSHFHKSTTFKAQKLQKIDLMIF